MDQISRYSGISSDDNVPISLKHCIERKLLEVKGFYEWSADIDVVGDAKVLLELTSEAAEEKNEDWTVFNQVFSQVACTCSTLDISDCI
jgi:hypothetical protein